MNKCSLRSQISCRGLLGAILGLNLAACGAAPGVSPPIGSGTRTASPHSASPSLSPGYKTYRSPKWLYSLEYPATWYDLPVFQGPDLETMKSFSNENTGSPEGMDDNGVFLTITVDSTASKPCAPGPGWNDP